MNDLHKGQQRLEALLTGLEDEVLGADEAGTGDVQGRRASIESLIKRRTAGVEGRGLPAAAILLNSLLESSDPGREVAERRPVYWAADAVWRRFPIREIRKRGWFKVGRGVDEFSSLRAYLEHAAGARFEWALHRRQVRGAKSSDEYALLAWQLRILERARERMIRRRVPTFEPDERWLPDLVALARRDDGVKQVPQFLEDRGVVLVIERHLPGTYLDGAAMVGEEERPVIGMTLRYDRLDNFWFVLFHELGHVFRHLRSGMDFFDDDEATSSDKFEREADRFALMNLISDEEWGRCLSRFSATEEAVRRDAERLGVHASILAGRIRRELSDYTVLGKLLGQNMVRRQFGEATDDPG